MYRKPIKLRESTTSKPTRVDFAKGMIYGVKVLSEDSRNRLVYPQETRVKAHRLLEGLKVNIDHLSKRAKGEDVPLTARFGKLINVREGEKGTYADLKFNIKHKLAQSIAYAAEELPDTLGMSIDGVGYGTKTDTRGYKIVEEIARLRSCDLVADPGSTFTLFESNMEPEAAINPGHEGLKAELMAIAEGSGDEASLLAAVEAFCEKHKGKTEEEEEEKEVQESNQTEAEILARLQTEKDCLVLCESLKVTPSLELIDTLADLPTDEKRKKLLAQLKKAVPAPKAKSTQVALRETAPLTPQGVPADPKAERARLTGLLRANS